MYVCMVIDDGSSHLNFASSANNNRDDLRVVCDEGTTAADRSRCSFSSRRRLASAE